MLDNKGFDLWADGYDKSVNLSEESNEYPFAGYKNVLNHIYNEIHDSENARILDIGFGTGVLTQKLYQDGYDVFGIDFSNRMIEIAKEKMPSATLIQYDFANGLPKELLDTKFDFVVSTYAIHHLTDDAKVEFMNQLLSVLSPNGKILIGDVAFATRDNLNECKNNCNDGWDDDEIYIVFEELRKHFKSNKIQYKQISHCAGIVCIYK